MREIDLQTAVHEIVTATQRKTRENKADYPFFLIVGAGISHPAIPLAAGIEKLCREEIIAQGLELPLEPETAFGRYQTYFELAFPHAEDRQAFLHDQLHNVPISPANLRLAHLLGEGALTDLVFTPNFDEMLTRALRLLGYESIVCDHPRTTQRIRPGSGRLQVVHVHGTHWFYDCCNLHGEVQGRSAIAPDGESMRDLLDQVLRDRSPMIVGYSGWEGDVIMAALKRRLLQTTLRRSLYWFCYKRSEAEALPNWMKDHPSVRLVLPPMAHEPEDPQVGSELVEVAGSALAPPSFEESGTDGSDPTLSAQQIFDAFNRRLELKAPKLTSDPLEFFHENLKANLHADGDLLLTDLYSISEVLRRVEKGAELERGWRQSGSENLIALERVRNAIRTAAYREAIGAALGINLGLLNIDECEELESLLKQAYLAVYASDPGTGLDACTIRSKISERALASDPTNANWVLKTANALYGQGYCLGQLGRQEEAIEAYRSAIQADPKNSKAWNSLGFRLGQKADLEPDNAPALRQEEIEAYRSAIQADPKNSQAWINLGFRLGRKADLEPDNAPALRQEEIEAYRRAIQADPKNSQAWINLGICLGQKADLEPNNAPALRQEAIEAYRRATQADPKNSQAWNSLGFRLGQKADLEPDAPALRQEEIEAYRSAIQADPKNSKAWGNLGFRLRQKAKMEQEAEQSRLLREEAIEAYRRAVKADPQDARVWDNLSSILIDKGHTGDTGAWKEALAAGHHSTILGGKRYNFACALALTGSLYEALEELKGCLDRGEITREHVTTDRDWESLRDDPRFKKLLPV